MIIIYHGNRDIIFGVAQANPFIIAGHHCQHSRETHILHVVMIVTVVIYIEQKEQWFDAPR